MTFDKYSVQSRPCGTYIGWCYYTIKFPDTKTVSIVTSFSSKRRFSIEAFPIDSDYLILNRQSSATDYQSITELTKFLRDYSTRTRPLLIPTVFQTFFIEILFHTLSVVEPLDIPISVFSPIFKKLDVLLNVQSEWLNRDFFTISEPFPVQKYPKFKVLGSLNEIEKSKNLVFCSYEFFDLNKESILDKFDVLFINPECDRLSVSQEMKVVNNNDDVLPGLKYMWDTPEFDIFKIKIETSNEELKQQYKGIIKESDAFFIEGDVSNDFILVNSNLTVIGNSLLLSGQLVNSDFETPTCIERVLKDEKPTIKQYLEEETPIFCENWYYLLEKGIKFRINNGKIEYVNMTDIDKV